MGRGYRGAAWVAVGVAVVAAGAVGVQQATRHHPTARTDASTAPQTARVAAPATLGADGNVPWVDEPAGDTDFRTPVPPPPRATGPHCTAAQLSGSLPHWIHKSTDGEAYEPVLDASLYGYAVLTNTSDSACTLHGVPTLQLTAGGTPITLDHSGVKTQGSLVGLPAHGQASFRIDWDAPFCDTAGSPYALTADVPGAGRLSIGLPDQSAPGCVRQETHPNLASDLSPGPIIPGSGQATAPPPSPLTALTAKIENAQTGVTPGQAVHFTGVLTNPTDTAVSLAGRPGFALEIFCLGTQGRTGLNQTSAYLLNNRPVQAVPAHGSVRFDLVAQLPDTPFPGPQLIITWRLLAVGTGQLPSAVAQFTVPD